MDCAVVVGENAARRANIGPGGTTRPNPAACEDRGSEGGARNPRDPRGDPQGDLQPGPPRPEDTLPYLAASFSSLSASDCRTRP